VGGVGERGGGRPGGRSRTQHDRKQWRETGRRWCCRLLEAVSGARGLVVEQQITPQRTTPHFIHRPPPPPPRPGPSSTHPHLSMSVRPSSSLSRPAAAATSPGSCSSRRGAAVTSALMFAAGKVSFRASRRPGREGRVRTSCVTMSGCRREMLVPGGGGGAGNGEGRGGMQVGGVAGFEQYGGWGCRREMLRKGAAGRASNAVHYGVHSWRAWSLTSCCSLGPPSLDLSKAPPAPCPFFHTHHQHVLLLCPLPTHTAPSTHPPRTPTHLCPAAGWPVCPGSPPPPPGDDPGAGWQ
jgi:hypothetical protein